MPVPGTLHPVFAILSITLQARPSHPHFTDGNWNSEKLTHLVKVTSWWNRAQKCEPRSASFRVSLGSAHYNSNAWGLPGTKKSKLPGPFILCYTHSSSKKPDERWPTFTPLREFLITRNRQARGQMYHELYKRVVQMQEGARTEARQICLESKRQRENSMFCLEER